MATITVHFNDGTIEKREVSGEQFLLSELEDQGVKIARGCFAGSCGVCRAEVLEGENNLTPPEIVEQDTIKHLKETHNIDFRMPCTCKAMDDVVIKADRYIDLKI